MFKSLGSLKTTKYFQNLEMRLNCLKIQLLNKNKMCKIVLFNVLLHIT